MSLSKKAKIGVASFLVLCLVGGVIVLQQHWEQQTRTTVTAFFANSNGIYTGDQVRILGVPVGKIARIEPVPDGAKVTFWVDSAYKIPENVNVAVISPTLVAVRAIQLTPVYSSGPTLKSGATIPIQRTAVPVEWDDLRNQLKKLTETLQPTQPGGVSTLGQFVNSAAGNLRGEGSNIRDAVVKLSQAFSALGDHSEDVFSTIKNLSILVSALQSSEDLMRQLNMNLAGVTALLANSPDEVGSAVGDLNSAIGDVRRFVGQNKDAIGTTTQKLASITTTLNQSLDDIKQTLHIAPTTFQNFLNIYQPAQGTLTGALALTNFASPISFLCGAVQAASRLGAEQSAKLCVQYLAPILKNRQYNFLPLGENLVVGASARPNEITYSEDWLRPDYVPPTASPVSPTPPTAETPDAASPTGPALPAEVQPTNPTDGLTGMMVPPGGGGS